MRKTLTILKEIFTGGVTIESVGKTRVSIAPGEVTQLKHN
jgi:hypothetical protein